MDQHAAQSGGSGEQNYFQPDSGSAPVSIASPVTSVTAIHAGATQMPAPALQPTANSVGEPLSWTALEYIEHRKSFAWFAGLGVVALLLGAVIWLIARDIFLASVIVVGVLGFGVYAARRPKQATYLLEGANLHIGARVYPLADFRSFSLTPEGALVAIELAPMKRFAVPVIFYCHQNDQAKATDLLSAYLPLTPPRNDLTDQFMRRIRF